jgi:hypothetical protein
MSSEALCILKGMTPITLKLEEAVTQYTFRDMQQQQAMNLYQDVEYRHWPHESKKLKVTKRQQLAHTQMEASIKEAWGQG